MREVTLDHLSNKLLKIGIINFKKLFKERFLDRIEIATDGCWNWKGVKSRTGYGMTTIFSMSGLTHRLSYKITKGEIPKGMTIDHLCRNKSCMNPNHLEVVTYRENNLRSNCKSGINSRKTHCPKGHPYSGKNLYIKPNGERNCRMCKREEMRKRRLKNGK